MAYPTARPVGILGCARSLPIWAALVCDGFPTPSSAAVVAHQSSEPDLASWRYYGIWTGTTPDAHVHWATVSAVLQSLASSLAGLDHRVDQGSRPLLPGDSWKNAELGKRQGGGHSPGKKACGVAMRTDHGNGLGNILGEFASCKFYFDLLFV
jgi:hypothetical protein